MPKCAVFSERAFISILVETQEKIRTETGGVFLGYRQGDVWYVIESVDPGPNSIFRPAYFEYDQNYINHLINKISRLYSPQLELIGLWHRHPGSFDSFSGTDDGTNTKYAELNEQGAISALVNIDPQFRLTVYSVTLSLQYKKIKYVVGDSYIPQEMLALKNSALLQQQMELPSQQQAAPNSLKHKWLAARPRTFGEDYDTELVDLQKERPLFRCKLGRASCAIDFDGNMCPCMSFRHVGRRLTRNNFEEIWASFRQYPKMKASPEYKCLSCKAYDFCDICPAMMQFVHGNLEYVDEHFCKSARARYEYYRQRADIDSVIKKLK